MKLQRFLRYILLFGFRRAIIKAAYHLNNPIGYTVLKIIFRHPFNIKNERIVVAGMGNHGFTLISYCILLIAGRKISAVIDPSDRALKLSKKILNCACFTTMDEAIKSGEFYGDILYICSDHRSHLEYAKAAVGNFSSVYIEKPIIVSNDQIDDLVSLTNSKLKIFTGYNRPNAPLTKKLISNLGSNYSLRFVVNGHFLESNHWYRDAEQGTRVLGNLSHWLDLSYRIFSISKDVNDIDIYLVKGYLDDIIIMLRQSNCTISIAFSGNSEPIDGVEEFIHWNSNVSVGFINNFKTYTSVRDKKVDKIRNFNKNVGHIATILSPFSGKEVGDQHILNSARLCLQVEEMTLKNIEHGVFKSETPMKINN